MSDQTIKKPRVGFYLAIGWAVFLWIIFLEHLSIAYPAIEAGVRAFLVIIYIMIPLIFCGLSLMKMYAGRRHYFRKIDLIASLVPPGILCTFLFAAFLIARVIGG